MSKRKTPSKQEEAPLKGYGCPGCRNATLQRSWHLVCPACWNKLPAELRDELWEAFQKEPGTERHRVAVRQVLQYLKDNRKAVPA